jgi:pimeloyl-ACP methyl ester carboxylesterase
MSFAEINGTNIYYEMHGNGGTLETLVMLNHGFGSTKMWRDIYPRLVEKGYRVILYDRRGYGQSEKTDFEEFYVSDRFRPENVRTLAGLMERLDIATFSIIAQCEGGVIGVDYAVKYPHQVKTMVISSTQCYNKLPMDKFNKMKFPKPYEDLNSKFREDIIYWQGRAYSETYYNLFSKYGGGGAYGNGLFDMRDLLQLVTCPTLVLYPDRSPIFDVEQGVEFYRNLPEGELAVIPDCGHNTYDDKPEDFIMFVLDFLKRHTLRDSP